MRLPVRRIYRAFPELDRFSDEQCRRFVKAASRGWRVVLHVLLILAVLIPGLLASAWAADKAFEASEEYQNGQRHDVIWAPIAAGAATIPLFILAALLALVVRDLLLRLRIGRILRRDSSCPKCHYRLVGLAVSRQSTITCPECGFEASVDRSLSELTINAEGKREFLPAIVAPPPPPFWTRKNTRRVVRIIALLILTPVLMWGGLVWWVGKQIDAASSWKQPPLVPIIESRQPDAPKDSPDGWAALETAFAAIREVDQDEWGSMGLPYNAHPLLVLIDPLSQGGQLTPQQLADSTARAQSVMEGYRSRGVYDRLREAAACRRAIHGPTQSWLMMRFMAYGDRSLPELIDLCAVRMELAARSGTLPEFTEALEARLALARILRQQIDGQSLTLSASVETATFTDLESHLSTHPSKEWLDAVDAAIRRQCTPLPTTDLFVGDQVGFMNAIRDMYIQLDDRDHRPELRFLERAYEAYKARGRIGSFDENRTMVEAYFEHMDAYAAQPPFKRSGPPPMPPMTNLAMFRFIFPDESLLVQALDEDLLQRRAYETLSALERFRLAHGDYPQKLDELTPEFLKSLPEDPWSGKPLGYVRVDPKRDRLKRTFLLYSVGNDRTDNGGSWYPQQVPRARLIDLVSGPSAQGSDYILNEPPEQPEAP
jgi:hypothetical protein